MCGIFGVASSVQSGKWEFFLKGRDTMAHRGPDDSGDWYSPDGRVALAHRRLAIIDLSSAGHQPMQDVTATLTVVFNGEIYNFLDLQQTLRSKGYYFSSHSDTEVLLAAYREWGTDCLSHLNGMFAFALFDATRQCLFLARDRAGEKPLFYSMCGNELRFASELKALLADPFFPRQVNPEALACYLAWGYVPGERCILAGVSKLPPAHALKFDLESGVTRVWRYWRLPPAPPPIQVQDETALLDELESLMEDSVRRQMLADVPVGILLSGGVDSSLVTAMAVRGMKQVKTFTVGFPGFQQYNETSHARLIANHFCTEHYELEAGEVTPDLLPLLAHQYDEPIIDSSMIPNYLISKLVREQCTVALGGDGGDELFGGYHYYNRLFWMKQQFGWMPRLLRKGLAGSLGAHLPTGFKGRNALLMLGCDFEHSMPIIAPHFDDAEQRRLLGGTCPGTAARIFGDRQPEGADLLQRATRMDFENYMADDILVKVDRASLGNSLEMRAPLLDYRIIEFAFGRVPTYLKATVDQRKILLKRLAKRILPPSFDLIRKQGFGIPLPDWLSAGPWRNYFREVLMNAQCLFDQKAVDRLFQGQDGGHANSERLFGLVLFELWRREYQISL